MNIVFASETLIASHPTTGVSVSVVKGQHWPADDPLVRAYPSCFTDDPRYGLTSSRPLGDDGYPAPEVSRRESSGVEETTAAPGEKRSRKAPRTSD